MHYRLKHLGFGVNESGGENLPATTQTLGEDHATREQPMGAGIHVDASSIAEGGLAEQRSSGTAER